MDFDHYVSPDAVADDSVPGSYLYRVEETGLSDDGWKQLAGSLLVTLDGYGNDVVTIDVSETGYSHACSVQNGHR